MAEGEAVMPYAAQWYASERPSFSFYCVCGLAITGQSEKGLHTLVRKHREKGIFHLEHIGETTMAVPEGIITTSDILVPEEVVEETVTEEVTTDEELDQA
jgi:hypothetical protein